MKFEIRPALPEDADAGSVLLTLSIAVAQRSIVEIRASSGQSVFCEAVGIDQNFVERYNRLRARDFPGMQLVDVTYDEFGRALPDKDGKGLIFINEYYRARLGRLEARGIHDLTVAPTNRWWNRTRACLQHPQVGIRLPTQLGLWGLGLGAVAVFLGGIGVWLGILAVQK